MHLTQVVFSKKSLAAHFNKKKAQNFQIKLTNFINNQVSNLGIKSLNFMLFKTKKMKS